MYVCNVVSKQKGMKAIWDSNLIEIYKLGGAKGPEHGTKTNRVS